MQYLYVGYVCVSVAFFNVQEKTVYSSTLEKYILGTRHTKDVYHLPSALIKYRFLSEIKSPSQVYPRLRPRNLADKINNAVKTCPIRTCPIE